MIEYVMEIFNELYCLVVYIFDEEVDQFVDYIFLFN